MQLKGELVNFYPPDVLTFVAGLNKEGILTITDNIKFLTITLKDGFIIDAQSETADKKILKSLLIYRLISRSNYRYLLQLQQETKMTAREILDNLNILNQKKVQKICINGIQEVFFEFFKLKNGFFKFTEVESGISENFIKLAPRIVAAKISQRIDEFIELERELSPQRQISSNSTDVKLSTMETIMINDIGKGISVSDLMKDSFMPSYQAAKLLKKMNTEKKINLHDAGTSETYKEKIFPSDRYFPEFKKTSRRILTASNLNGKLKALVNFCKLCFNDFFIVSAKKEEIIHLIHYFRDTDNILKKKTKPPEDRILMDSFFVSILGAGGSFFGDNVNTNVFLKTNKFKNNSQCAIIPYNRGMESVKFIYAITDEKHTAHSPLKYLEILSWMLNPEKGFTKISLSPGKRELKDKNQINDRLEEIAETINELPPMPHTVTQLLNLISDPDYDTHRLIELISQDQSIMAAVIKVSNSVLYRAMDKISTVNEAVKRLGMKAIKGIAVATATRSMFPDNESDLKDLTHQLWLHSKECGIISKRIAVETGYHDPDEAFVGGILHDIGKLAILIKSIENFRQIREIEKKETLPGLSAEKRILGYNHAQVGALLMKKWNMPEPLVSCVRDHHENNAIAKGSPLTDIIFLANFYFHTLKSDFTHHSEKRMKAIETILSQYGFDEDKEKELVTKLYSDIKNSHIFD